MAIKINPGGALALAIVSAAIVLMLEYLPTFDTSPYPNHIVGVLTVVVGTVLDLTRLKARVFFMTREAVRHNLEILREIKPRYGALLVPEKATAIDAYAKLLENALSRSQVSWKNLRDTGAVQKMLTAAMTS